MRLFGSWFLNPQIRKESTDAGKKFFRTSFQVHVGMDL